MTPYYEAGGVCLYCGDAAEVLGQLDLKPASTVVLTDPPWPEAPEGMFPEVRDAAETLAGAAVHWPRLARRAVVWLSTFSDPAVLAGVPRVLPYRVALPLLYDVPSYRGSLMRAGDVAHVFGAVEWPEGRRVVPGFHQAKPRGMGFGGADPLDPSAWHPCPRLPAHARWLVRWLTQPTDVVVDPFAGSGTTLREARALGRRAVGVEIREDYCERMAKDIDRDLRQGELFREAAP